MSELLLRLILTLLIASLLGCGERAPGPGATPSIAWSNWSNGMRIRVGPVKPVVRQSETPFFAVQFQAQRTLDASVPYLLPNSKDSVIGPFTTVEVWVANVDTGARYQDTLSELLTGRSFSHVPEGTFLQQLSTGKTVTAVFPLSGEFMPAETVETLREARRQGHVGLAHDLLPKSLQHLPPSRYTVTLSIRPCPLESPPGRLASTRRDPPERYRDVWLGVLTSGPAHFEAGGGSAESTLPASREAGR